MAHNRNNNRQTRLTPPLLAFTNKKTTEQQHLFHNPINKLMWNNTQSTRLFHRHKLRVKVTPPQGAAASTVRWGTGYYASSECLGSAMPWALRLGIINAQGGYLLRGRFFIRGGIG